MRPSLPTPAPGPGPGPGFGPAPGFGPSTVPGFGPAVAPGPATAVAPAAVPAPAAAPAPAVRSEPFGDTPVAGVEERPARCLPGAPVLLCGVAAVVTLCWALWRIGALDRALPTAALPPPGHGGLTGAVLWAALVLPSVVVLLVSGGLVRGRAGSVWVLSRSGAYRGTVRRTGLLWLDPVAARQRVDVRLRHWRSRPMPAVDSEGVPLQVVVLLVWRVRDSARARFSVDDHEAYLRELVESAVCRVFSQAPADDFRGVGGPTLRDAERVGEQLTRLLAAQARPAGLQVFAARPLRLEYAPQVAEVMHRTRVAALDARFRTMVLDDVLAAVEETVARLVRNGPGEPAPHERRALAKDLTVAFWSARGGAAPYPAGGKSRADRAPGDRGSADRG
ncbi:SPFH domain-containing protein [Streptomyces sp. HB2AG]|uniref:SPFH domain-containing protein n=1 Tax=Streptomyces sp. HB2AG TaxID=2983400 RepID=UPI0022AABFD6|nr:SPFH domain-containing protein [Streptomyces sp. HB2AG]MCZ2525554.1 SPFH domain-containing protein [Streptomyces sp. HB2AG]